jgi:hypothetical protein
MSQLSDPLNYDLSQLIFQEPEEKTIPGQKSNYYRVGIKTRYDDGSIGDLILGFDRSNSFGISNTYGHTLSIQLYDRDFPTDRQRKTVQLIEQIVDKAKDFLVENRKVLKKPTLTKPQLDGLTPIKYKLDDDGKVDETKSPMINVKLLTSSRKQDGDVSSDPRILTHFYSEDEVDDDGLSLEVNPMDYLNKRCFVTCAVKIEGIFFGQVQKLQVKLLECNVKSSDSKPKRLLQGFGSRPVVASKTTMEDDFAEDTSSHLEASEDDSGEKLPEEQPVAPIVSSRTKKSKK